MVTFRNNNNGRRNNFRRNDRNFKPGTERSKFSSNFTNNDKFQRKAPGRNNHNASKLIEKYNNLAREALSVGDKILSENYFQHADHFTRILTEQEIQKKAKHLENKKDTLEQVSNNDKEIEDLSKEKENKSDETQSDIN
jgi:hypothetical protein|tara:strand:- start:54 stop:470 length:417 start_codon:yes stop_codon:yes gene_type:complete